MKTIVTFLLLLFIVQSYGQISINGILTDAQTGEPVPYATVYLNGTTKGTISNMDGRFSLSDLPNSGLIIVSHISYKTTVIEINDKTQSDIKVVLTFRLPV